MSAPSVAADGTFGIAGQVYDAGTSSYTAGFLVTSSDGVTWTRHDAPAGWIVPDPAGGWFSGPADWRGELPGVSPVTLSRSADGVTWTTTDITPVLATLGAAVGVQNTFAVAGGIAIAVQILGDPPATVTAGDLAGLWPVASAVLFTTDGQRWSIERPPSDLPSASSRAAGSQILASLYNPAGIVPGGPTSYAVGTPIG